MLLRLGGKSKQREEEKSAENGEPSCQLDRNLKRPITTPEESGDKSDTAEIKVGLLPGDPRCHSDTFISDVDGVNSEWYREHYVDHGKEY